jgi:sugar lactone lactonase YvrE
MEIKRISPSFISTDGATDGQVLAYSAASNSISFSAAGGGGGVTVYANASVLPNTGISIGSEAYVESTDSLYIWTVNNVWQQISTVNTPPSALTNYLPIYYLASNGAATTISFISSDPEDIPLSWGYNIVSGVLGNTTITNSANVFTITPSTNSVDDGLFAIDFFASDGLYSANANIQFNLSFVEGWNVSNATLIGSANVAFSTTAQETDPFGVQLSANGTTMYVVGAAGSDINQYTLSAPFNIDSPTFVAAYTFTANASANNFANPRNIQISPDGSNVYAFGSLFELGTERVITQFSLPTPNNLATMTTNSRNRRFSVAPQETDPTDLYFRDDGTRMYIIGTAGDDVNEYRLSQAWNPNTASFTTTFLVSGKETTPQGIYFTPSGNAFYIVGSSSDAVHRYDMSTAWSVNSASFISSFPLSNQETAPNAVEFKPDGTRMYIIGDTGDDFNEYTLSTPWDITTASFVRLRTQSPILATIPTSMRFSNTGANLYMTGTSYEVHNYTLSEAWNVATISYQYTWAPIYGSDSSTQGIYFNPTGEYFYIIGQTGDRVTPFHLRTPWDLKSAYLPGLLVDQNRMSGSINHFRLKPDGTKIYVTGLSYDNILEYSLSIPWDIASAAHSNTFSLASDTLTPQGIDLSEDGTEIYVIDGSRTYTYKLATPWALSSAYRSQTLRLPSTVIQNVFISPTGANVYIPQSSTSAIHQYTLTNPWDLDSISSNTALSLAATASSPRAVTFNDIGTKMYVAPGSYLINEYTLSTPWNVTTATYTKYYMFDQPNVASGVALISLLKFSADGKILYIGSDESGGVEYLYAVYLTVAYDLSSIEKIVHTDYYNIDTSGAGGIEFSSNGDTLYLQITSSIYPVDLSTAYDISSIKIPARPSESRGLYQVSERTDLGSPRGLAYSSNGKYAYTATSTSLYRLTLEEPYNLYSAKHPYVTRLHPYGNVADYYDISIKGNSIFTVNNTLDSILKFPVSNVDSRISFGNANSVSVAKNAYLNAGPAMADIIFKPDGTKLFVAESGTTILEYDLLTPWDLTSISLQTALNVPRPGGLADSIKLSSDGYYLYVLSAVEDKVYQYKLAKPWTVSTSVLINEFSVATQETAPESLAFSDDGAYMYVMGTSGDDINQYTLSTPWNISTATFTRTQSISAQDAAPTNLTFKPDGSRLYVRGIINNRVSEYALSTPWNVSSLTFTRQLQLPSSWSVGGIALNYNGTRLYVGDSTYGFIREYIIGS